MILMIDNFDSFTYNLVQYLEELNEQVLVYRNNAITCKEIELLNPTCIVISPGPGSPDEAGISTEVIRKFAGKIPILGVCLGHQAIGQVFGARIIKADEPVHGKVHEIKHLNYGIFKGLKNPLNVTRYHSLIIDKNTIPQCLEVIAWSKQEEIMGIKHKNLLIEGVQFHPEAILTEMGMELLNNFLAEARKWQSID